MRLTQAQWHTRYLQQAQWTHSLRSYLYAKWNIQPSSKLLDVGCGTGVLEKEFTGLPASQIYGIDIDLDALKFARNYATGCIYTVGNGLSLPYPEGTFDVTFCHFFLLWVHPAQQAVNEMVRVTRSGGFVAAIAEPDYGGRIDYPDELAEIGKLQADALEKQGAEPLLGRKLRALFSSAGLEDIEAGILGSQWREDVADKDVELEWQVLASDLSENPEFNQKYDEIKALELASRREQRRILFVPVFYAIGRVAG